MLDIPKDQIKGYECVFATYSAVPELKTDALIIKENVHLHDGRVIPNMRMIRDKEWPFYITRKGFRNHQEQKEYEDLDKVQRFKSTRVK